MTPDDPSPPYCIPYVIPHCTCRGVLLVPTCLRALVWPMTHALDAARAPAVHVPWITPRGGQNRLAGGAKKFGPPLHARESKNPGHFFGESKNPGPISFETFTFPSPSGLPSRTTVGLSDGTVVEWEGDK